MIQIADGFEYKGNKPLDSRLKYATITEMVAVPVANLYDGCEAYVTATKKYYSYDSTNEVDETLGKWRERQSGGSGTSDYSALSNKPQIEGVTLSGNKTASDLGLAKLTDLADFITKSVNDLVNYYTKSQSYSKTEVDAIVTAIKNSRFEVVATLPTSDIKTNVIYLVPSSDPKTSNTKDEYINLDGTTSGWEKIGSTSVDLSGYVTETELNTILSNYVTSANLTTILSGYATTSQLNDVKNNQRQTVTYIAPTASMHGEIWQYLGADMVGEPYLKSGYFYRCDYEGQGKYKWTRVDVQPSGGSTVTVTPIQTTGTKIAEIDVNGTTEELYAPNGGGGGGHTIEDAEGTDLTQRDTMQFGTGFNATDDSENEKTVVEADVMQSGDMDDIVTPLPSIAPKKEGIKYSTTEQVVGEWINGKPLYERTFTGTTGAVGTDATLGSIANVDTIVTIFGKCEYGNSGVLQAIPNKEVYLKYQSGAIMTYTDASASSAIAGKNCAVVVQYTKTTDTATT